MKRFLLLVALFCSSFFMSTLKAQTIDSFIAENVEECTNSKALLWSNLKSWISNNFQSYSFVVDMEDKESGRMIIKFKIGDDNSFTRNTVSSVLQVDVKDQKFRTKVSNIEYGLKPNDRCSDFSWMTSGILERAEIELKAAESLLFFGTEMDDLDQAIEYHKNKLKEVPKYRRPKDEKKGKVNKQYAEIEKSISMGEYIKLYAKSSLMTLLSSLNQALKATDDF